MNRAMLKLDIKSNWAFFLVILSIMLMYMAVIAMMYDPGSLDAMTQLMDALPKQMIAAFGFEDLGASLTSFMASYYYGFIVILFPMILTIVMSVKLISRYVDRGSMAYLLSSPVRRSVIAGTQAAFTVLSFALLFGLVSLSGYLICEAGFPGELEAGKYWMLNVMAFVLFMAITGISFLASCSFDDAKASSMLGSGLPLAFYVIHMLSNVSERTVWLKNLTIFSFYDVDRIMAGEPTLAGGLALMAIAVCCYAAGIAIFSRRDIVL